VAVNALHVADSPEWVIAHDYYQLSKKNSFELQGLRTSVSYFLAEK
jgi:hypothetical protein